MIGSRSSIPKQLVDWSLIRLSRSVRVDGLWVSAFCNEDEKVLGRLCEALRLIQTYDPYRYKRVLRETDRIWATYLPGYPACYVSQLRRCMIDSKYVLSSPLEFIASSIVHE